jgi:hypothetical protein
MKTNPIDKMLDIAQTIIVMIDDVGACPDLSAMQQTFSDTVDNAMKAYKEGQIQVDIRTLPPVMYAFAMEELPILCQGSEEDLKKAKQQLKLFIVSIRELVKPRMKE